MRHLFFLVIALTIIFSACSLIPIEPVDPEDSATEEPEIAIHVAPDGSDTEGDGSAEHPFETIAHAMTVYEEQRIPTNLIRVAQGDFFVTEPIILADGVELRGGHSAATWQESPESYPTVITDTSTEQETAGTPQCVFFAGEGITKETLVAGFTIFGTESPSVDMSGGINLIEGSPTIRNCHIQGGQGSNVSVGVFMVSSEASVVSNTINGGGSPGSYAVYTRLCTEACTLAANIIDGGVGNRSYGVFNNDSYPTIHSENVIDGGTGTDQSCGIMNNNSSPLIDQNMISGGDKSTDTFGISNYNSSPSISNNIINGGSGYNSCGIENENGSHPLIGDGNEINGGTGTYSCGIRNSQNYDGEVYNNFISGGTGSGISYAVRNEDSTALFYNNVVNGGYGNDYSYAFHNSAQADVLLYNNTIDGGWSSKPYAIYNNASNPEIVNNIITISSFCLRIWNY
jgi:hypothetical protein